MKKLYQHMGKDIDNFTSDIQPKTLETLLKSFESVEILKNPVP